MTIASQLRKWFQNSRLRSISHSASQCRSVPTFQPATSVASSDSDITLSRATSDECLSESSLRALERKARKVKTSMSCDGCIPDSAMREGLADTAYLAIFGVLDLVAEVRRLRELNTHQ